MAYSIFVLIPLSAAVAVSFWSSLVEATYLSLSRFSLVSAIDSGSVSATKALAIVDEKTKLVSVTTFIDTISNVVLVTSMGLVFSGVFGPIGFLYSVVIGSLIIMVFLYLLPKAIGIENSLRMAIRLAPETHFLLDVLSPVALPLTNLAKKLSEGIVGKPMYGQEEIAEEFEEVIGLLEKGGHIEPDAGRLLRSALTSSKSIVSDLITPVEDIVSVKSDGTVLDAVTVMGKTNHPRIPVYDENRKIYVGAVTFRSISKAIGRGLLETQLADYMIQPARLERNEKLTSVFGKLQDAGTTIAFVFEGGRMVGMLTLSDIIEKVLGIKV